jgi:hypothetical protein
VSKPQLPPPLVRVARHPLKWTRIKAETLVTAALLAHVGMFAIVALYYILFETWHPLTQAWHELGPEVFGMSGKDWSTNRHMVRDVAEGFLGGFLAQQIIWNHFSVKQKALKWWDKVEIALHIPNLKSRRRLTPWQLAFSPLLAIIYAVPGFLLAVLFTKWLHAHSAAVRPEHVHTIFERTATLWKGEWDKKVVGYGASLVAGRRPMRAVFDFVQGWFAERRVLLGKALRFYHPPTFRARYNDITSHESAAGAVATVIDRAAHQGALNSLLLGAVVLLAAFAGFGYYVLTYIAH